LFTRAAASPFEKPHAECASEIGRIGRLYPLGVDAGDEGIERELLGGRGLAQRVQKIGSRLIEVWCPAIMIERFTGPAMAGLQT
jgi:hypothetical protein